MTRRRLIGDLIAEQLATANSAAGETPAAPGPRVAAGPVRAMGLTLDRLEQERQSLAEALADGAAVVDLDPALIDASFAADRFDADEEDSGFLALKQSIEANGQEVPVLVRPSPGHPGRFQAAYGHRRLRACAALGRKVKAIVRPLDDAGLVIAQGLENAARVDLSFIEKASFARALEDRGFDRPVIMAALSTDKTELSKLIATARAVPAPVARAIGPAPKAGRRRWMQLARAMAEPAGRRRVEQRVADDSFRAMPSDARFLAALAAAEQAPDAAGRRPTRTTIRAATGEAIAEVADGDRESRIVIDRDAHAGFADFVTRELPALFERFQTSGDAAIRRR